MNETNDTLLSEVLHDLQQDLEEMRKIEMQDLSIRTHAKWIEEGEKPTKYFCNLEKRNFINNQSTERTDTPDQTIIVQQRSC